MIANKLNLANESVPLFSLWIISDELELQIRPRVELFAIVKKWRRWFEKYTHQRNDSAASGKYKFLFKREAMLTIEQERQTKDEVAIKLLYGEARNSVMNGRYPVKLDDAVTLAALQLQISFGDFYVNKHGNGTGFLSQTMDSILPEYIIQKNRLPDLEQKLIMAWNANALKAGVSPYIEYLDFLRKFSFYGATFFTVSLYYYYYYKYDENMIL
jgi:hypothetical protein